MKSQNTNLKVLIGNATTAPSEASLAAFIDGADEGEVRVYHAHGGAPAVGEKFMIASKKAGKLDRSEAIDPLNIVKAVAKENVAASPRVEFIGFNGASGSIDEITNNLYTVNIEIFNYGSLSAENRYLRFGNYNSTSVVTQEMVAQGVTQSIIRNFAREAVKRLSVERVSDAIGDADGVTSVTFVKGQSKATVVGGPGNFVVGDSIRVGTTSVDSVYKITSISGGVFTLDTLYQGDSETVLSANLQRIAAADAETADFGIKISGVEQDFDAAKLRFEPIDFRITLVDFGDTSVTLSSAATKGLGDGRTVAEEEWFAEGNFGEIHRMGPEPHLYSSDFVADASKGYHVISMMYNHSEDVAFVNTKSPRMINVYFDAGATTAINAVIDSINTVRPGLLSTL